MPETFPKDGAKFRYNNFDFLRLVLAVVVLLSHSFFLSLPNDFWNRVSFIGSWGGFAVNHFFFLSGFLIAASWMSSRSTADYIFKRVRRIYPAFLIMAVICAFVIAPLASQGKLSLRNATWTIESIIRTLTLHGFYSNQAFVGTRSEGTINGSVWTVRYEFLCYFLVLAFGLLGILKRPRILLTVGCLFVLWWIFPHLGAPTSAIGRLGIRAFGKDDRFGRFATCFTVGMVFFVFRERIPRSFAVAVGLSLLLVAQIFLLPSSPYVVGFLLSAYPILYLAYASWLPCQGFGKLGDFSYGVYIWGWPVQAILIMRFPALTTGALFVSSGFISVLLGAASWHLVEKHFLKRAPQHQHSRDSHSAFADSPTRLSSFWKLRGLFSRPFASAVPQSLTD